MSLIKWEPPGQIEDFFSDFPRINHPNMRPDLDTIDLSVEEKIYRGSF
jgi:hypothetical protein